MNTEGDEYDSTMHTSTSTCIPYRCTTLCRLVRSSEDCMNILSFNRRRVIIVQTPSSTYVLETGLWYDIQ